MAFAPSINASCSARLLRSWVPEKRLFLCTDHEPASLKFSLPGTRPSRSSSSSTLALARRRKHDAPVAKKKNKGRSKQILPKSNDEEEEDLDEDAFEALFNQLEQDLKNDGLTLDDNDDDISEEDLARLERELEEALGGDDLEMFAGPLDNSEVDHAEAEDGGDDDDDVESPVELKRWQLRRLAVALKAGRRKTRIKSLAAELCLDRSIILELLRDPPPNLLLMSATLPDEPAQVRTVLEAETAPIDVAPHETTADAADPEPEPKPIEKVPLHVMRQRWSAQKRLKKVQVETLERVYRRTKRPTNAMISSIVQVTSLPRKRIVKWFEDRRTEDGVPKERLPYERPVPETVS